MADDREATDDGQEPPRAAADRRARRSGASSGADAAEGRSTAVREGRPGRVSPLKRLTRFLREVVAELRKVIWPTRSQLVNYTLVVLVFVAVMVAYVAGLDLLFAQGVTLLFGN